MLPHMRHHGLVGSVCFLTLLFSGCERAKSIAGRDKQVASVIGKPAPEISGEDGDGRSFRLSDYRGKVVLLDFWATW
jgi:hypothetical protein